MRLAKLGSRAALGVIAAYFALAPAAVTAQTETGRIEGVVTDPQSAVVADAVVTVTSLAGQAQRQVKTDANGRYVFPALKPGTYEIRVEASGFAPAQRRVQL